MSTILEWLFNFVIWIFVPGILVLLVRHAYTMAKHIDDERHKTAAQAGFWAGVMLFLMSFVYKVGIFVKLGFPHRELYQGFDFALAFTGGVLGFLVVAGGRRVIPPKLSGWVVMAMSFLGLYAFMHYLFIRTYNELLLSIILGIAFGALAHFAASPASFREFLRDE